MKNKSNLYLKLFLVFIILLLNCSKKNPTSNDEIDPPYQSPYTLFVSTTGSDSSNGLTSETAFLTLTRAMQSVEEDADSNYTISIMNGIYSPSTTGEEFPINVKSNVRIRGDLRDSVIFTGSDNSAVFYISEQENVEIRNLTVSNSKYGINLWVSKDIRLRNLTVMETTSAIGGGFSEADLFNIAILNNENGVGGETLFTVDSCQFINNSNYAYNISLLYSSHLKKPCVIKRCKFIDNFGAVYCNYGSGLEIYNSIFSGNVGAVVIEEDAGGVYFENITVVNNESGIASYGGLNAAINSIFWNNPGDVHRNFASCPISYSCYNNMQGFTDSTNKSIEPLFVDTENNNFHLAADSPCIDAGNPDESFNDADGSRNDMGAYGGLGGNW